MSIRLEVWGDNALFTRGEFLVLENFLPSSSYGKMTAIPSDSNRGTEIWVTCFTISTTVIRLILFRYFSVLN